MENTTTSQPLDALMNQLGLTNAQLVEASTEQLSFKMVQKGRKGKRLTPNIQEKILTALLKVKPGLQVRRRDLFRYELNEAAVEAIQEAMELIGKKKIKYPEYVSRLAEAGLNRYAVDVAAHTITFYGSGGEAHVIQGPRAAEGQPGSYDEARLKGAIAAAQKEKIDHPTFLRYIYEAGITSYETNLRERKIVYKSAVHAYREDIPEPGAKPEPAAKTPKKAAKKVEPKKPRKSHRKKPGVVRTTRKARVDARKRFFIRKRKGRGK